MSRPKLKGNTIGVHLALSVDAAVRERAVLKGMTPGTYLSAMIEKSLTPKSSEADVADLAEKRAARRVESNNSTIRHPSSTCLHSKRSLIAAGLSRCEGCGKTKGVDGVWR